MGTFASVGAPIEVLGDGEDDELRALHAAADDAQPVPAHWQRPPSPPFEAPSVCKRGVVWMRAR